MLALLVVAPASAHLGPDRPCGERGRTSGAACALWAEAPRARTADDDRRAALRVPVAAPAPERTWPPRPATGLRFIHFGEEHLTDADGPVIFPRVVSESARWKPDMVLASGDKSDNGSRRKLEDYRAVMDTLTRAGVPWFGAVGNHDRDVPVLGDIQGGVSPIADLSNYKDVYAGMPYPFGDAAPISDPRFWPRTRPAGDPAGASSHYTFDYGNVRVIVIDNSCQSITNCTGSLQNPPEEQWGFLRRAAIEGAAAGRHVWVLMHQPTRDPRDQTFAAPVSTNHQMGKGISPDNVLFELVARDTGVDAVLVGHIKGQWQYSGTGGVRYFIDGGAGGELYTNDEDHIGVDTGYWYGYRLLHVDGSDVTTDVVPLLSSLTVEGPTSTEVGQDVRLRAFGRQPATEGVKVERLELRDPDRSRPDGDALPTPTRIWTSFVPQVLRPVSSSEDDPRRDPATQTDSGVFLGRCPGRAVVEVMSGFNRASTVVTVASRPGAIAQRAAALRRTVRRGRSTQVASIDLAQPARVLARVKRGRTTVATLADLCHEGLRRFAVKWSPKGVRPGRYTLELRIRSDRPTLVRRSTLRVR